MLRRAVRRAPRVASCWDSWGRWGPGGACDSLRRRVSEGTQPLLPSALTRGTWTVSRGPRQPLCPGRHCVGFQACFLYIFFALFNCGFFFFSVLHSRRICSWSLGSVRTAAPGVGLGFPSLPCLSLSLLLFSVFREAAQSALSSAPGGIAL